MAEPILVFEGVRLESEDGRALFAGLHWRLERGAKVALRASSAGESTALLRLAAGLAEPSAGRVLLDGVALGPYSFDHPFLRRGALGWVPREGGLLVNQNLRANVALPLMFTKGMKQAEAEALAGKALEAAGLARLADHRPHVLDPGERWLCALVRAHVMAPELWLVDQPASAPSRPVQEAAAGILGGVPTTASMLVAGEEDWGLSQDVRLDNGHLQGNPDAIRA